MAREVKPNADRLAALTARFGEEAESFFLNAAGDFLIGIVESTGSMTTEFGPAPYVDFLLEEGDSAETDNVTVGKRYRFAFLGTVLKGRFDKDIFTPGTRFAAMNRGKKSNKNGTQEYNNVEVRVMGSVNE